MKHTIDSIIDRWNVISCTVYCIVKYWVYIYFKTNKYFKVLFIAEGIRMCKCVPMSEVSHLIVPSLLNVYGQSFCAPAPTAVRSSRLDIMHPVVIHTEKGCESQILTQVNLGSGFLSLSLDWPRCQLRRTWLTATRKVALLWSMQGSSRLPFSPPPFPSSPFPSHRATVPWVTFSHVRERERERELWVKAAVCSVFH